MKSTPTQSDSYFPNLGFGLGLRSDHYSDVLKGRPSVAWYEVVAENYMSEGGRPLSILEKVRQNFSIALHGVSLSIGSIDELNIDYLKKLKHLINRIQPAIISDHCCWTGVKGENLHDLMPLPFTEEVSQYVIDRVCRVQDFLGRRIALENVSSYLSFNSSEMAEWEFLSRIANEADCGILLDVNNIYVSSVNHQFDPIQFIQGIPTHRVAQIHLAGHTTRTTSTGRKILIDTHSQSVCSEVWDLYRLALDRFGSVSTMVEWDEDIPDYQVLENEIEKARIIEDLAHGNHQAPQEQVSRERVSQKTSRIPDRVSSTHSGI